MKCKNYFPTPLEREKMLHSLQHFWMPVDFVVGMLYFVQDCANSFSVPTKDITRILSGIM